MVQRIGKLLRFYSDMHSQKMQERKQSLITRFLKAKENDSDSESESLPESMFNESIVGEIDFDGFMAELDARPSSDGAGPSTSGGSGSQ